MGLVVGDCRMWPEVVFGAVADNNTCNRGQNRAPLVAVLVSGLLLGGLMAGTGGGSGRSWR